MKKLAMSALVLCLACGGAEEETESDESTEALETPVPLEAQAEPEPEPQPESEPEDLTRREWAENERVPSAAADQEATFELPRESANQLRESLAGALTSSSSPLIQQLGAMLGQPHFRGERAHVGDFRLYDIGGGRLLLEHLISGSTATGRVVQTIATRSEPGEWSLMEPTELALNSD